MALPMCEKIQIAVRASNLKDEDVLSKSDPFVEFRDVKMGPVGKTEVIKDCLNPQFKSLISMPYYFEKKQEIIANVWDFDDGGSHDLLGSCTFTVGQLMSSRGGQLTLPLQPKGTLTLTGLHEGQTKGLLKDLRFRGRQLKNMDTLGKSDPFFILSRVLPSGDLQTIYKSETVDNSLDPDWKKLPSPLDLSAVFGGNLDAKVIKFQCFDEDVTENEAMGEFVCSATELASHAEFPLVNPKNLNECFGYITAAEGSLQIFPSFLGLLKAGLQLNVAFSIDFTGSNLECTNPKSLHYYHPTQPNQYVQAMLAVSDVVQEYDSDRQFPAFGFGAVIPGSHEANHFFNLSLGPTPYIAGMQAVIDTYVGTLKKVRLYGPTNFAPTIRNVATGARQAEGVYTILLIMTDGEITDMDDTITEIVNADDAPFSILIVGVGNADFVSMEQLDCDNGALRASTGRVARRDIVQFVPMRDFAQRSHAELAAALLAEIPDQVSKWAMMNPAASQRFFTPQAVVLPPAAAVA